MRYHRLGRSSLSISSIAFGGWQLGDSGYWGADDAADEARVVATAADAGINLFDTAEMYGNGDAERALGRALRGRRQHILVASKFKPDHAAPPQLRAACEASLTRLETDHLDLYQVHWPFRDTSFQDAYAELSRLRDEGKIREIGVSNFGPRDLAAWRAAGDCCSNQVGYNLLFRAVEFEILPMCRQRGIGVLAYMPLMQGILTGRYATIDDIPEKRRRIRHFASTRSGTRHGEPGCERELVKALNDLRVLSEDLGETMATLALAWVIAQTGVTSVILGARKVEQLRQNLRALEVTLEESVLERLDSLSLPIKESLGANADMWDAGTQARIV